MELQRVSAIGVAALVGMSLLASRTATAVEPSAAPTPPKVGEEAQDFELPGIDGKAVKLSQLAKEGPVVVVVLRGWPGYQCPLCAKQFASFLEHGKDFAALKASVVFIYPGPEAELEKHAEEFVHGEKLPAPFVMALDPGFNFTTVWGLRWDAPAETSHPSTFVLDAERKVKFQKISPEHGNRAHVEEILKVLKGK